MRKLLLLWALLWVLLCQVAPACAQTDSTEAGKYDVDVRCLIHSIVKLAQKPLIVEQLKAYNRKPHGDPRLLDQRWPTLTEESPVLRSVLDNPANSLILRFIALVSLGGEGMLIGQDGGLVAATNHTTDFWQGDEEQFLSVIDSPTAMPHVIAAYPDESTQRILIKVAAPVLGENREKLGVLVVGFDAVVMEYRNLCQDQ